MQPVNMKVAFLRSVSARAVKPLTSLAAGLHLVRFTFGLIGFFMHATLTHNRVECMTISAWFFTGHFISPVDNKLKKLPLDAQDLFQCMNNFNQVRLISHDFVNVFVSRGYFVNHIFVFATFNTFGLCD